MLRAIVISALVTVLFVVPARAQVKLEYKLPDGGKSTAVTTVKTKQNLTLQGMDIVTAAQQTITVSSMNGQRAADGTLRINSKIDALKATINLPGGVELQYDSSKPDPEPLGTQFDMIIDIMKVLSKSTWTAVHGSDNRVLAIEGRDKGLEQLDANLRGTLKKQFDADYLKQVANDELDRIPQKELNPGDTWELTQTRRLEGGQNLTFKTKYQYQGTVDQGGRNLDQITVKTTEVQYTVDADAQFQVSNSELEIAESAGQILFDRAVGQVVASDDKVNIKGSLTLNVNGVELPGQLDLTLEQRSKRSF